MPTQHTNTLFETYFLLQTNQLKVLYFSFTRQPLLLSRHDDVKELLHVSQNFVTSCGTLFWVNTGAWNYFEAKISN